MSAPSSSLLQVLFASAAFVSAPCKVEGKGASLEADAPRPTFVRLLTTTPGPGPSLFLDLCLGLIRGRLRFFESLLRRLVRLRRRNISGRGCGIRSFRESSRSLFLGKFSHAVLQLFAEVVVHLLQIIHRDQPFAAYFAI